MWHHCQCSVFTELPIRSQIVHQEASGLFNHATFILLSLSLLVSFDQHQLDRLLMRVPLKILIYNETASHLGTLTNLNPMLLQFLLVMQPLLMIYYPYFPQVLMIDSMRRRDWWLNSMVMLIDFLVCPLVF